MSKKGPGGELEVVRLLEPWWGVAEPGSRFVRTPSSGGWHGPQVRAEFKTSGDIMTTALRFPWAVEVKRREAWSLDNVLRGRQSPVWGWWRQACAAAAECGLAPMMWFRQNRQPWYVMLPKDYARHFSYLYGPTPIDGHRAYRELGADPEPIVVGGVQLLAKPADLFMLRIA